MQTKPKFLHIFLVTLVASLLLSACTGGGSSGSTWFNLPSVKVKVQEDGTAKVYGLPVNQVLLPPEALAQLQAGNVQNVDLRAGYNGVHAYVNGEDMPYLAWDEESVGTLQDIVKAQPDIPNAGMIASALPWLRKIGLGASLAIPAAGGQQAIEGLNGRDINGRALTVNKAKPKEDRPRGGGGGGGGYNRGSRY